MNTHIYYWFEGDAEKREMDIQIDLPITQASTALDLAADQNKAVIQAVVSKLRFASTPCKSPLFSPMRSLEEIASERAARIQPN